jgi:ABC-type bacteriocin/lantibiotic exporter with double-glycine peptidase domain
MNAIEHAHQWSDSVIFNIITLFMFIFATPMGWCILGVIALSFIMGMLNDSIEIQQQVSAIKARAKAQAKEAERLSHIEDGYRSPAGYRRGVKED